MPRNGIDGTFTRVDDWTVDAASSIPITASLMDADTDDIANEITNSVAKDGQTTMTGNLKMGSNRITGVGNATAQTDAPSVTQIQNGTLFYATTTGSSNAYVLTLTPAPTAYVTGQTFHFITNFANTGSATLNVNGLGAKTLKKNTSTNLESADIASGQAVFVVYDGTNFQIMSTLANQDLLQQSVLGVEFFYS